MAKAATKSEIQEADYDSAVFEEGGSVIIDLSGVKERSFEAIPKGIYNAEIDALEFKKSKKDAWMYEMVVKLVDNADYNRRTFFNYLSFSEKALPGTKATLLKIDPELFAGRFDAAKIANEGILLGRKIRVKMGHEEYEGETQSRVRDILPPLGDGGSSGGDGDGFFGN
jgi:hypothetical protein